MTSAGGSAAATGPAHAAGPGRVLLSIGEVLAHLRADFPDITISKLRFLESEGLVEPLRTPAGYRKYSPADISRLRYVLTAQRDQYLPLRVIREQLAAWERGAPLAEPAAAAPGAARGRAPLSAVGGTDGGDAEVRLTRSELRERSGIDEPALAALEQHGLLGAHPGGWYDADALTIALLARQLAEFGLQPRHLRAYRVAADRELGLFAQLVAPLAHQVNPQARAKAGEVVRELALLTQQLQAALVRAGLRSTLGQ